MNFTPTRARFSFNSTYFHSGSTTTSDSLNYAQQQDCRLHHTERMVPRAFLHRHESLAQQRSQFHRHTAEDPLSQAVTIPTAQTRRQVEIPLYREPFKAEFCEQPPSNVQVSLGSGRRHQSARNNGRIKTVLHDAHTIVVSMFFII